MWVAISAMLSFAVGLFSYLLFVGALLLIRRLRPRISAVSLLVPLALVSHALGAVAGAQYTRVDFWPFSASYAFLVMMHVLAFGAVHKSVSLRLLTDLAGRAQPVPLSAAEAYVENLFAERGRILVLAGLAETQGDTYAISTSGKQMARRLIALQRLFGIEQPGLYKFQPPGTGTSYTRSGDSDRPGVA